MIEVFPIGAAIQFGQQAGVVIRIQIAPGPNVVYEVGYWTIGGEWKETWVNAFMVTSAAAREKIGYSRQAGV